MSPKTHFNNSGETFCLKPVKSKAQLVDDWDQVTCRTCLKIHAEEERRDRFRRMLGGDPQD